MVPRFSSYMAELVVWCGKDQESYICTAVQLQKVLVVILTSRLEKGSVEE